MAFHLTAKQIEAQKLLGSPAVHHMLFGGSRSGKTFLIVRAYVIRAMKHNGARQAMFRLRFNAIRSSIVADTFPKVMRLCFDGAPWKLDKTEWKVDFPNGSEIWFGGLDDKERTEKVLGQEHCGIFLNECSQIPWPARNIAVTRLAQNVGAKLRMDYDENPPTKGHWSYKLFIQKLDPESGQKLPKPDNYASMQINPEDNKENLTDEYMDELDALPARMQKRFKRGEFTDIAENALWSAELLDKCRHLDDALPDMQRIIVSVDPSGADEEHPERDSIGIIVAGLGVDGLGYVLEDLTLSAKPAIWGSVAASAYRRHTADLVVGEDNFGGAMVKHVIQTAVDSASGELYGQTPYKSVTASRGKVVRAEPIAALYEQNRVRHVGYFPELEDELQAFTTTGYQGGDSPNRADALVWALTELFPGMVKKVSEAPKLPPRAPRLPGQSTWMGG